MRRLSVVATGLLIAAAPLEGAAATRAGMRRIPAGEHRPLYGESTATVRIGAFFLDRDPVTRRQYLAFVRTHAAWRRSSVGAPRAVPGDYLTEWRGDLDAGSTSDLDRPVTGISWHAAGAYCSALGKRLPLQMEWEYAAAPFVGRLSPARSAILQRVMTQYATRSAQPLPLDGAEVNHRGLRALHDRVWEWVADPNAQVAAILHASHGQHQHRKGQDMSCAGAAIGASDPSDYPAFLRAAFRSALTDRTSLPTLGFRCAA